MSGDARLVDLLQHLSALAQGVRLRIALDVLADIVDGGDAPLIPRTPKSPRRANLRIHANGRCALPRPHDGSGIGEIVWEILAGKPAPRAPLPRLSAAVDDIAESVDEVMASALSAAGDVRTAAGLLHALERAGRAHVDTHAEVRNRLGIAAGIPDPRSRRPAVARASSRVGPATTAPGAEHRRHARLALAVDVDLQSNDNFYAGQTRDISLGGIFVSTDRGLEIGAALEVALHLLGRSHHIAAEVVWIMDDESGRTVGAGLRFIDMSAETREAIEQFMEFRPPLAFEMTP